MMSTVVLNLNASIPYPQQCLFETKVTIGVYYESLCPDSRNFITKQLYPTYQKLGQNLDVEFKPYGKASVSRDLKTLDFGAFMKDFSPSL